LERIIEVVCSNCGRLQKAIVRKAKATGYKTCVFCGKKINKATRQK
jgi:hypothetical protein